MWRKIFEVASPSAVRDFQNDNFVTVKSAAVAVNAICSRLEVADNIISGESVDSFWDFIGVSLWFGNFSGFRGN